MLYITLNMINNNVNLENKYVFEKLHYNTLSHHSDKFNLKSSKNNYKIYNEQKEFRK